MPDPVVFISQNHDKARELRRVLPDFELELLDLPDLPEETGSSYYDNARAKVRFGRTVADFEAWILAEDSGVEVAALGGAPGIRSARFAALGEDPVRKLLRTLEGVEEQGRFARYVCELVLLSPQLKELRGTGVLDGRIARAARGSEGFGYDPIFVPEGQERTVAELGNAWKDGHSHRALAAQALLRTLDSVR